MFRLIYRSTATQAMSAEEIALLLTNARRRNAVEGITGLLLYHNRQFLQVIEGNQNAVRECFDRVSSDTRHRGIRVLSEKPANTRAFTKWFMGYDDVKSLPPVARLGTLSSGPINPAPLAPNPQNIRGLGRAGKCGSFSKRPKPLR